MARSKSKMNAAGTVVLLLTLWLVAPVVAQDEVADALVGLWATERTENGIAHVRISRDGDRYHGEIVWLEEPDFPASEGPEWAGKPKVDRNNPDPKKQSQPIIGLRLAWGFQHADEGRWDGGRIYDPENGKTYKCRIRKTEDGRLEVRGFIGFALIGRTTVWTGVDLASASEP